MRVRSRETKVRSSSVRTVFVETGHSDGRVSHGVEEWGWGSNGRSRVYTPRYFSVHHYTFNGTNKYRFNHLFGLSVPPINKNTRDVRNVLLDVIRLRPTRLDLGYQIVCVGLIVRDPCLFAPPNTFPHCPSPPVLRLRSPTS